MNKFKVIINKSNFKLFYLPFLFLNMIPFINIQPITRVVLALFAGWGAVIIINDILSKKLEYYKKQNVILLVFYLCISIIATIINFSRAGLSGFAYLGFTSISFLILLINDFTEKEKLNKEIWIINISCVIVISIELLISLLMFFTQMQIQIVSRGGYPITLGFFENRLYGVFSSPNVGGIFAGLGIFFASINFFLLNKKPMLIEKILYIVYFVVAFIYISLANSRGSVLSLIIAITIFAIFVPLKSKKTKAIILRFSSIVLCCASMLILTKYTREVMSYIPYSINYIANHHNEQKIYKYKVDTTRVEENRNDIDISNKRFNIWSSYYKVYKMNLKSILFGINDISFAKNELFELKKNNKISETDEKYLSYANNNVHNGYLEVLIQYGIFAFILIILFILNNIFKIIYARKVLFNNKTIIAFIALLIFILVDNIFESNFITRGTNSVQAIFLLYLGYILTYIKYHYNNIQSKFKNVGFYCATPFHILAAINLKITLYKNNTCDLYVLNHFDDANDLVSRFKELKLFRNVKIINYNNRNLFNKLKRVTSILFPSKIIRSIYTQNSYSDFYFFAYDFINISLIIKKYYLQGKNCKFIYGDDGVGSYIENIYTPKKSTQYLLKFISRYKYLKYINTLAVYNSELVFENSHFNIEKIPQCNFSNIDFCNLISKLWPGNNDFYNKRKIIYFQQMPFEMEITNNNYTENDIFNAIKDANLIDDTTIKPHPRSKNDNISTNFYLLNDKRPFEVILQNLDVNNKILISPISTALFSPYLMYGQRPTLIILNTLLGMKIQCTNEISDYFKKFIKITGYEKKIFVPKDINEFKKMLVDAYSNKKSNLGLTDD